MIWHMHAGKEYRMNRLEAFEKMLADIQKQADYESRKLAELKAAGKEKTATYRQYFGNRMIYKTMLDKYREYGLLDTPDKESGV